MKKYLVGIIFFSLLCASTIIAPRSSAQHAPGASPDIVISQVYGGAGTSGATYNHDYIELFNRGNATVSVAGWSVQYASAAGNTWQVTSIATGSIQPGQHFFIQENAGTGNTATPTPDVTGGISMSGTQGKVALVTNTTALTCGSTNNCTSVATVKDFIGYGAASSFEGSGPAPGLTITTAALRSSNGCVDSDSNASDLIAGTPNPRNTASALTGCTGATNPAGAGTANPSTLNAGDPVVLTVTVTPGTNPGSTGLAVTVDLTSIGGSAAQTFYDDGTHGDVTSGNNTFTFATSVPVGTSAGIKTLPFTISDAEDRGSAGSFQLTVQGTSNPSGTGSASPNTVAPGGSTVLTFSVIPGTAPTSTGIAVRADLSSIGGSSVQTFNDDGNNSFSSPAIVGVVISEGFKTFPVTITDAQGRTGSGSISLTVQATVAHTAGEHEVLGNPSRATTDVNNPSDYLMEKNQYVLSYNRDKGTPNWVEWHLDTSWLGSVDRSDDYREDTLLPAGWYHVQGTDYTGSPSGEGFDRGHMCPSGDRTNTPADNSATFLMTNFIPQAPVNNQLVWGDLENYCRSLVQAGNELYIFDGPAGIGGSGLRGGTTNTIVNGHVTVPAWTWKVIVVLPIGSNDAGRVTPFTRIISVIMPNVQSVTRPWGQYRTSVSQVEGLTGLRFFTNVAPTVRQRLRRRIDTQTVPNS
jgi:endonuclease G